MGRARLICPVDGGDHKLSAGLCELIRIYVEERCLVIAVQKIEIPRA
jgi:hypothetical protein